MAEHYVDNQRFLLEMTEYQNERQRAKDAGVRGYPTIFINGEEFEGPRSVDAWVEASLN